MKKIFLSIFLCLSVLSISAQPQRSNFRQLLSYGGTPINAQTIIPLLTMNPQSGLSPEEAQHYGHHQLLDDMRVLFLPYYRPTLTSDDITFILAILHSPDVNHAMRRLQIFSDRNNPERAQYLTPAFGKIMQGEEPEAVTLKEGVPQEYLDACTAYYLAIGQAEQTAQLKNSIGQNTDNADGARNMNKIIDYIIAYSPTVMANVAWGKVPINDFKTITSLYETKAFQHFKAGNLALSAQSHVIVPKLLEMAKEWKAKKDLVSE